MMHARRRWAGAVLVAALVVTGCGDDDDTAATTTQPIGPPTFDTSTTEPGLPTTPTTVDPRIAELTAAYEAAEQAAKDAAAIPDPSLPALALTHTGSMLQQRQDGLLADSLEGIVTRYPPGSQYREEIDTVEFVAPDIAILEVCAVDDGERVEVATGRVLAGSVGTIQWRASMQLVDGSWRLAEREELSREAGVVGCAVD
ncbi:MAG: hypothetical protein ACRD0G_07395 [Acidimicrobiales bacterium]